MTEIIFSSRQAQEAIWALLPERQPGITAAEMHQQLPHYKLQYIRSILSDMNRSASIRRDRIRRGRNVSYVLYCRGAVLTLPEKNMEPAPSGMKRCNCGRMFKRAHRWNYMCSGCLERASLMGSCLA